MGQASARLLDDLRSGRVVVRAPVAFVVVLIRVEVAVGLGSLHPARLADRAVSTLERIGQHQPGAERPQNHLAFGARVVRQAQLHAISPGRADHRVRDASVAGSRVENGAIRRQRARRLAVEDHAGRRAILDRAAGVLPLGFGPKLHTGRLALEALQPDERGAANQVQHRRAETIRCAQCGRRRHVGKIRPK
jgi:hypothetical protein